MPVLTMRLREFGLLDSLEISLLDTRFFLVEWEYQLGTRFYPVPNLTPKWIQCRKPVTAFIRAEY